MSSIDERIVKMTFDNSDFEAKVSKTITTLDTLNDKLKNVGSMEGLSELSKSIKEAQKQLSNLNIDDGSTKTESKWKQVASSIGNGLISVRDKIKASKFLDFTKEANDASTQVSGIGKAVDSVGSKFSAMGIMATTALVNITNGAVDASKKLIKSLTIEPVTTGFSEYELKMNSISTILANTADEGKTLEDVSNALNELNTYADQTIYNFAQMTDNIGRFTAAGVSLEDSVSSIKGLANLAAFFGVEPAKASSAMYQMSQALAAGKVQLMDWNSLVNAGMGGEAFQKALIRTSEVMGTGADKMIEKYGSFRDSLTKGEWLTADVMIETLKQISGAYKESELRAQGYSATQAKAIADMAKTATKSATEVRTITGMIDTMKEAVQSGWAISWEHIIGDKEEATELLTGIKDAFEAIIEPSTTARNKMLEFWNTNGGREDTIKGLSNIFKSLGKVMGSIGDAWKEVFPSMTGEKLVELSKKFKDFTEKIKISDKTVGKIKNTFKGVFSVLDIVKDAILSVVKGLTPLTGIFKTIGSAALTVTSSIGKFASGLGEAIEKSKVFDKITSGLKNAFNFVGNIFSGAGDFVGQIAGALGELDFSKAFSVIIKGFSAVGDILSPVFSSIAKVIGSIDFGTIMKAAQTASFLNVLKTLKETFGEVADVAESAKGMFSSFKDIGKNVKDVLNAARESLEAWQRNLQAEVLFKIAGAVSLLAASLILISSIDGNKLMVALAGMAGIMTELSLAYIAMMKYGGVSGVLTKGIGGSLLAIATSVLILAAALKILSGLDAGEMLTGITGVLIALGALVIGAKVFDKQSKNLQRASKGLIVFGVAMIVMAGALKLLGSIDAETLGAGLFALAGVLTELALFLAVAKFGDLSMTTASALLILSGALIVLSQAVKIFGQLKTGEIVTGLAAIAGIMAEILIFSKLGGSGLGMIGCAAGLAAMSVAITLLSGAMRTMGSMKWDTIGKGLSSLAGAMLILGAATALISGPKMLLLAVGLSAMGVALTILAGALKILGSQSWEQVAISLVTLAGALAILAVAMYAMTGCIAGAAAMLVMSAALALFIPQLVLLSQLSWTQVAIGLVALAGALTVIGVAGYLIVGALPGLLGLGAAIALIGVGCLAAGAGLSLFATGFALVAAVIAASGFAILEFIRQLINLLPEIGLKAAEAMVNFAGAIGNGAPQIISAFSTLLQAILTAIQQNIPLIAQTGVDIVVAFAQGLAQAIPELVTSGMEMILSVLEGIAANIGPIVEAGADICINFMDGVAEKLPEIIDSGINLALTFIEGVADGITNNQDKLESAVESVIEAVLAAAEAVITGGIDGFIDGGTDLINGMIEGMESLYTSVSDAAGEALEWAKKGVGNCGKALYQAGRDLITGFGNGITSALSWVEEKARSIADAAKNAAKKALGINSPSRVFREIGEWTGKGMVIGLNNASRMVVKPSENLANTAIDCVSNSLSRISDLVSANIDAQPVITPVVDLSNVRNGSRRISELLATDASVELSANATGTISKSIGQIQNGNDNSDIIAALNDLKNSIGGNTSNYTINGITYDDGSNIASAVETLVKAAKIERRM